MDPASSLKTSPSGEDTILVIDDDDAVRELIVEVLREGGYRVIASPNAWCADLIVREDPVVILIDIMMPGLKGDRAVQAFSETPGFLERRIVLLHSSLPEQTLKELREKCGANGYHSKDGDGAALIRRVGQALIEARTKRSRLGI